MKLINTTRMQSIAAVTALFLGAVSFDAAAQAINGAQPIATGQGVIFDADVDVGEGGIRVFAFNCVEKQDGTVSGSCNLVQVGGFRIRFDVTSYDVDADGNVILAGPVTSIDTAGNDPNPPVVGWTAVVAVRDDDAGTGDALTSFFVNPPVLSGPSEEPLPFTTLEEIYDFFALYGLPYGPESLYLSGLLQEYQPISEGNVNIF